MQTLPEFVHFECSAGHRVKAARRFAGRAGACPACGTRTQVPKIAPLADAHTALAPRPLTDSGIERILDEFEGSDGTLSQSDEMEPTKSCPRCKTTVSRSARVCYSCNLYLAMPEHTWNSVLKAARRSLRS